MQIPSWFFVPCTQVHKSRNRVNSKKAEIRTNECRKPKLNIPTLELLCARRVSSRGLRDPLKKTESFSTNPETEWTQNNRDLEKWTQETKRNVSPHSSCCAPAGFPIGAPETIDSKTPTLGATSEKGSTHWKSVCAKLDLWRRPRFA